MHPSFMGDFLKEVAIPATTPLLTAQSSSINDGDWSALNPCYGTSSPRFSLSQAPSRFSETISFPSMEGSLAKCKIKDAGPLAQEAPRSTGTNLDCGSSSTAPESGGAKRTPNASADCARVPEKGNVCGEQTKNSPTTGKTWASVVSGEHPFSSECTCQECRYICLLDKKVRSPTYPQDPNPAESCGSSQDSPPLKEEGGKPQPPKGSAAKGSDRNTKGTNSKRPDESDPRRSRLPGPVFLWSKDNCVLHKSFLAERGKVRSALYDQIMDAYMVAREDESPCGDDFAAAREERQELAVEAPKPKNIPHDYWDAHLAHFRDGDKSYDLALPDTHSWMFAISALALFVMLAALSLIRPIMSPLCAFAVIAILAERLSAYRMRSQYDQVHTNTGARGVYRVLTWTLQCFHVCLFASLTALSLCVLLLTIFIVRDLMLGWIWFLIPDLLTVILAIPTLLLGFWRLKQEVVSVMRQTLTLYRPHTRGVTTGRRINDPDRDTYVVDDRPESEKGTDLTIDTVSIGNAIFSISVSVCTIEDDAPNQRLVSVYETVGRFFLRSLGYGSLQYSLAELQNYLTATNTNILYSYETMHERIQNYRSGFHRVGFSSNLTTRTQELRTNTAWMAAFIALSQQLILKSVAGEALPLTVRV